MRARHAEAFGSDSGYAARHGKRITRRTRDLLLCERAPNGQPVTVTIAFRWPLLLRAGWGDTRVDLPAGRWRDALTGHRPGGEQRVENLLEAAPVALLERA